MIIDENRLVVCAAGRLLLADEASARPREEKMHIFFATIPEITAAEMYVKPAAPRA
jgi:hypothetical protein